MNKQLIKKRFTKSLDTYEQQADMQLEIAHKLAVKASQYLPSSCQSLLEIGCGTGFLTRELLSRLSIQKLFLNDLVDEIAHRVEQFKQIEGGFEIETELNFLGGDAEQITLPDGLQGVLSASTLQWMVDLPAFFNRIHHALLSDGIFLFNTFGPENFREIKTLMKTGLDYPTASEIQEMLSSSFDLLEVWEESHIRLFDTPRAVLRHLQETGVTATSGSFRWNKKDLHAFENSYGELFSEGEKVKLTWQVYYFVCKKRSFNLK